MITSKTNPKIKNIVKLLWNLSFISSSLFEFGGRDLKPLKSIKYFRPFTGKRVIEDFNGMPVAEHLKSLHQPDWIFTCATHRIFPITHEDISFQMIL